MAEETEAKEETLTLTTSGRCFAWKTWKRAWIRSNGKHTEV
jgi:hypothetical protein